LQRGRSLLAEKTGFRVRVEEEKAHMANAVTEEE